MTLTREMLDNQYAWWFHSKRNTEQAKQEILFGSGENRQMVISARR